MIVCYAAIFYSFLFVLCVWNPVHGRLFRTGADKVPV